MGAFAGQPCIRREPLKKLSGSRWVLVLAAGMGMLGCGGEGIDSSFTQEESAIYQGVVDLAHESVGLIIRGNKLWCTATRIGKGFALSAGHCFEGKSDKAPKELFVRFSTEEVAVVRVEVHPKYQDWMGRVRQDLALLFLAREPAVPITPILSRPPTVGEEVTLVGYGYTDALLKESMDGTRRSARSWIGKVEEVRLFFPAPKDPEHGQNCRGDSGGPAFLHQDGVEVQIGVTSGSLDAASKKTCAIESYSARADAFVPWIQTVTQNDVALYPPPPPAIDPASVPEVPLAQPAIDPAAVPTVPGD